MALCDQRLSVNLGPRQRVEGQQGADAPGVELAFAVERLQRPQHRQGGVGVLIGGDAIGIEDLDGAPG
jgi:hypothetical protein